ncbi:hypothetical protein OC846_002999 [Tilletia horrida]|uniref:Eukaryotic translation initiation factor 3 subunit H n=1 Tax=Tilletia horrida TaxID=155126 RepID=A0AAN6JYC7_9BASI|nr:hypothetical protein OC846_002999 [Tilletia horrida]
MASTAPRTRPTAAVSVAAAAAAGANNRSNTAVLESEADSVTSVQLDGLALMKIIKHSRDAHPAAAAGALVGIDVGEVLDVSNSFAWPASASAAHSNRDRNDGEEAEERGLKGAVRHTSSMIRLLRDVNADANPVGMYQSCFLGSFLTSSVIDGLVAISSVMERDGATSRRKAILLVHDLAQSAQGNAAIKAYRFSAAFLEAHKKGRFHTQSLIDNKITFSNILVEVPVVLHNTTLLNAFLATLSSLPAPPQSIVPSNDADFLTLSSATQPAIQPSYSDLTLALGPVLSSSLESTLETVDDFIAEAGNVGYQARQLVRERARAEAWLARRRAENAAREAQGLEPLPGGTPEEVARMFKLGQEPNRLESLLLLNQLDGAAKHLVDTSAVGIVQLHAARTGAV